MKKTSTVIALAALFALFGCPGPQAATKDTPEGSPKTENGKEAPKEVSASLKHEAYEWMGFGRLEPFTYELTRMEGAAPMEGTQTLSFLGGDDKAAKFQFARSGGLAQLGDEEFELRPDGIYQTAMPSGTLTKPGLLMPADVKPGSSWKSAFEVVGSDSKKFNFDLTNKAERVEKVKTKGGDFDALLIVSTGKINITEAGKTTSNSVSSKTWYVKGLGHVKMSLEVKLAGGVNNRSTVELIKAGTSEAAKETP